MAKSCVEASVDHSIPILCKLNGIAAGRVYLPVPGTTFIQGVATDAWVKLSSDDIAYLDRAGVAYSKA